jgi:hypothetical protein
MLCFGANLLSKSKNECKKGANLAHADSGSPPKPFCIFTFTPVKWNRNYAYARAVDF